MCFMKEKVKLISKNSSSLNNGRWIMYLQHSDMTLSSILENLSVRRVERAEVCSKVWIGGRHARDPCSSRVAK
jgi:hypothetical protein